MSILSEHELSSMPLMQIGADPGFPKRGFVCIKVWDSLC